mmetsp:Transcript_19608/g.33300  ORF Transcript_19608/g.33300 Transcript_19608/m.33300 type:complete len:512 (+) Transcript_19608:61-1596(+)
MSELHISVTDPTKCKEGFGTSTYISYKIHSTTDRPQFATGSHSVVRRYNDFTWLVGELSYEFPGAIVPPLPEKQSVGRFSDEFIESRRRALEKFLTRVAAHHELGTAQCLIVFLQADETGLNEAKKEAKNAKSRAAAADSSNWIDKMTTSKPDLDKSAADIKIEEIMQYINLLEKQLANVTKFAENLVKRSRETSLAFFDFAQGFNALGASEGATVGPALTELGNTAEVLAANSHNFAEMEVVRLVEPLEEYSRMLYSIKGAMQQRLNKKNAYLSSMIDVEAKQNAYRKVLGVPGKEALVEVKEQAVANAQKAADNAKSDFEKVSERLLTEFELFKNQKAIDIKQIISSFVDLQVEFNKKSEEAWNSLVPVVENVVVDTPEVVRSKVQDSAASAAKMPDHHFSVDVHSQSAAGASAAAALAKDDAASSAALAAAAASENPFDEEEDEDDDAVRASAPPPPPPTATTATAATTMQGEEDTRSASEVRAAQHSIFSDDTGEGGDPDDDEVEGV